METDFGGRKREVVENPPIGRVLAALSPRGVQPLRQRFSSRRDFDSRTAAGNHRRELCRTTEPFRPIRTQSPATRSPSL